MADPTAEELEGLLELQATDDRIRRVDHELRDLPEQRALAECAEQLAAIGRELEDLALAAEQVGAEQRQLEREVDILGQRRDAERARLYDGSVGSAREMQAVEAEVASTERRISEHEDLLLEVLERVEQLDTRRGELEADRTATTERERELEVARDAAAAGLLAELGERKVERDRQAAALPPELLARYEQVAARTGGSAVGKLAGNACSACRLELSAADVGELYAGPPLTTCPECRRLLVVPA